MEVSFEDFRSTEEHNTLVINKNFQVEIELFKCFFDIQNELLLNHINGFVDPYYHMKDYEKIIVQSFIKTNHLLYTSLSLTCSGNFGASNILQRQIFEYQVLGKYTFTTKEEKMIQKWLDGNQFDIYDKVIKRLNQPSKDNFHHFWRRLCVQCHATTSSHQIEFKASPNEEYIHESLIIILMLLRCNYHLLTSCLLTNKLIYRSEHYFNKKKENASLKSEARLLKKRILSLLSISGKNLIKDYESTWSFRI